MGSSTVLGRWRSGPRIDEWLASGALLFILLIPLIEVMSRPLRGQGIPNAPVLVQHLGLVMAMFGAVAAERHGHLTALGSGLLSRNSPALRTAERAFAQGSAALICGLLAQASWRFVSSEWDAGQELAYGIPIWWVQATMPIGFLWLGLRLGGHCAGPNAGQAWKTSCALTLPLIGCLAARQFDGSSAPLWPIGLWLVAVLLAGAPIFAVLGGLALALFAQDAQPLASVPLSHYQITVNPSLPALPLFTLAGLIFARTEAARRLGTLFTALFGGGVIGTVVATAVLCSCFTAFTGGSGVTILALGGLLLPLLRQTGYPEQRGISLVTSASALGVLLAPSVPLIMYAIIARVPINTMFLAGLVPAVVMIACLLLGGGFLRRGQKLPATDSLPIAPLTRPNPLSAARAAIWDILAPVVAIGALISGLATPTEGAAITAAYAIVTQALVHRELNMRLLGKCINECAQLIGGVMLILGMALGLTNFLIDAGIPDAAIEWVQSVIPNRFVFLLALNVFLFFAGALMEIYAAIVVLVPLLLPVASSYGIDPVHFGIIFLANMEMGFLCPPAGMNLYFASAMFNRPIRYVASAVGPALLSIFAGTLIISWVPLLATWLPEWLASK